MIRAILSMQFNFFVVHFLFGDGDRIEVLSFGWVKMLENVHFSHRTWLDLFSMKNAQNSHFPSLVVFDCDICGISSYLFFTENNSKKFNFLLYTYMFIAVEIRYLNQKALFFQDYLLMSSQGRSWTWQLKSSVRRSLLHTLASLRSLSLG